MRTTHDKNQAQSPAPDQSLQQALDHNQNLMRQLEHANMRLVELDRLKSEFISMASHDLKTPLVTIMGYLQLLLKASIKDPADQKEALQRALESSKCLLERINSVLAISKIQAGHIQMHYSALAVANMLAELAVLTRVQAASALVGLEFAAAEAGLHVKADAEKLKQIFLHLIGNALKYTPSQGRIKVSALVNKNLGYVRFEISDTGKGIAPEQLGHIFAAAAPQNSGGPSFRMHGYGLAISKYLVEHMGGTIGVSSLGPGQGATFYFTLPYVAHATTFMQDQAILENPPVPRQPDGQPLLLIVEDDPDFARLLQDQAKFRNIATLLVGNLDDAYVLAETHQPDLISIDWALPQKEAGIIKDSLSLVEKLAIHPRLAHTQFVFLTGHLPELLKLDHDLSAYQVLCKTDWQAVNDLLTHYGNLTPSVPPAPKTA